MALFALLLAGCGRHDETTATPSTPAGNAASADKTPAAVVEVSTAVVAERPLPAYLEVIGELRNQIDSALAADVSGKVVQTLVERGAAVKKGDVLIKLDDRNPSLSLREAAAAVTQAQARLTLATADYDRNAPLAKTKAIAEADFQKVTAERASAEADLEAAKARRDTAQKAVDDTSIRAPFDGIIAERRVNQGEFVQANTPVVQLISNGSLRMLLYVPENAVGEVKMGQTVTFKVPAYTDREFSAKIIHIGAALRDATRDLLVEAEVPNDDAALRQGMFASGRLGIGDRKRLALPASAVKREGNTNRVLVVTEGKIEEHLVDLGESHDGWVEVRNGVTKDAVVVVNPKPDAVDGASIKIVAAATN